MPKSTLRYSENSSKDLVRMRKHARFNELSKSLVTGRKTHLVHGKDWRGVNCNNVVIQETALGRGVFAEMGFDAHEIVGEVKGIIHDEASDYAFDPDYCMDLGGDAALDPKPPFRFLNHSCEPNCELVLWKTRRQQGRKYSRLWLQTLRAIEPGEELTIDYAWPAEEAIPCRCHSRRCRGWIVHPEQTHHLRQLSS